MKQFITWLFNTGYSRRDKKTPTEKLLMSMRVTAKCRYNAANRLLWQNRFSFITTTVLSLGLIFIPLMQNAGVDIPIKQTVLNMMQIFLAVAVLVYSIVIATAQYELRAEKLTSCGDKLKELIRSLDKISSSNTIDNDESHLSEYQEKYSEVTTRTENHSNCDYTFSTLEMRNDYNISGLRRLMLYVTAYTQLLPPFIIPILMLCFEILFITDMIGLSNSLPDIFRLPVSGSS